MNRLHLLTGASALLLLAAACSPPAPNPPEQVAPGVPPDCDYAKFAEIDRSSLAVQCLDREDANGKPFHVLVPIQPDGMAYATRCSVTLRRSNDLYRCNEKYPLDQHLLHIDYADPQHRITLIDLKTGTVVLDNVDAKAHGTRPEVEYLYYETSDRTYYFYLVDQDPTSARQSKFYRVEVFENGACPEEIPENDLDVCATPSLLPSVPLDMLQNGSGGGYEPPKTTP